MYLWGLRELLAIKLQPFIPIERLISYTIVFPYHPCDCTSKSEIAIAAFQFFEENNWNVVQTSTENAFILEDVGVILQDNFSYSSALLPIITQNQLYSLVICFY